MASYIHFGPALSCKIAAAAMFLHGLLISIKCDSYISKLCNLINIRMEAVNSSRISTVRSYTEYKSVILKVTSPIPAGLLRSPSFSAPSLLLSFRYWNGRGNRSREDQVLKKSTFTWVCVKLKKKISFFVSANFHELSWGSGSRPARIFIRNLDTKWTLVTSNLQKEHPVPSG